MALLGGGLVGGLYLDGWAHIHVRELETFFTPWHAVLYGSFLAQAGVLAATFVRHRRQGHALTRALPVGYGLSLAGAAVFLAGGLSDMVWHAFFGVEVGVEALLSPTHLVLAVGGGLMLSGPLRAALHRSGPEDRGWRGDLPMILSATWVLSLLTFFTEYASPFGLTWMAAADRPLRGHGYPHQAIGVTSILFTSVLVTGLVLVILRSGGLARGSLTLMLSINVTLMTFMHDKYLATGPYPLIAASALAGLAADGLAWRLRPSVARPAALRTFAFAVPLLLFLFYVLAVLLTVGTWWTIHLWTGTIVLAGLAGWLSSYVLVPPSAWRRT